MGEIQEGVDVIVIGAGPGGYVAAIRAAELGRQVTLIEAMPRLGGVCLNWGCIPSKALIHVANIFHEQEAVEDIGISVTGKSLDWKKTQEWKEGIVKRLSQGIAQLCKDNGVQVIPGKAHFTSSNSIQVTDTDINRSFKFNNAIIATGSRPIELANLPFDKAKGVVGSRGILSISEIPKRLAVIGAGYIGIELGIAFAKLGSKVTIVEMLDQILPEVDTELTKPVARKLKSLGIEVFLQTTAKSFENGHLQLEGEVDAVDADTVMVAVGRRPNTEDLCLDVAGVKLDEKGFIQINQQCQSSQAAIYAIGDAVGGMMLAHKASAEGKVAAEAMSGRPAAFDNRVPAVIFSDPEIATVGLSERAARDQGLEIEIGQFPFAALGRALASNTTDGFVKVVAEAKTKRLLGFQMVGPHVSELIATATHALEMGALTDDLSMIINTHPTFSEAIGEAVESIYGQAIHLSPRKQKK